VYKLLFLPFSVFFAFAVAMTTRDNSLVFVLSFVLCLVLFGLCLVFNAMGLEMRCLYIGPILPDFVELAKGQLLTLTI
jgi:hypothetical protein